jgi:hypothetical protein
MRLGCALPFDVMAGLVPAIHAAPLQITVEASYGVWAWMPGTRLHKAGHDVRGKESAMARPPE